LNVHQVAPRQPILLATSTIDAGVDALAEAGIYELLSRPLVRTEVAAALKRCPELGALLPRKGEESGQVLTSERRASEHIFAIETILSITVTTSAEIFAALFALLVLALPCTPFTRYVRNTITDR
jgi:hypothetical protein